MRLFLSALVLLASAGYGGIDVLVAHCDPDQTTGAELYITDPDYDCVDFLNVNATTPDLATLLAYDVVFTWSNYHYQDATLMGNTLADYVDAGGAVVIAHFAMDPTWGLLGRIMSDASYCPMNPTGSAFLNVQLGAVASHDIMDGVISISNIHYWEHATLRSGATWLGDMSNGEIFAAINSAETIVALNLFPGDQRYWTGDGWILYNNAIKYLGTAVPLQRRTWGSIKTVF